MVNVKEIPIFCIIFLIPSDAVASSDSVVGLGRHGSV